MTQTITPYSSDEPEDPVTSTDDRLNFATAREDSKEAIGAMLEALSFGNRVHGPRNWHHIQNCEWVFGEKLLRHLFRYLMAPTAPDVKSGLHHLAHVMANAALLFEQARMRGQMPGRIDPQAVAEVSAATMAAIEQIKRNYQDAE